MYRRYEKYHNRKTVYDGKTFASKKEADRYAELRLLERAGKITGLMWQVPYLLIPAQYINGKCVERSCVYVADFVYHAGDAVVVEDTKGVRTPEYIIKRKLMLKEYGIRIKEI